MVRFSAENSPKRAGIVDSGKIGVLQDLVGYVVEEMVTFFCPDRAGNGRDENSPAVANPELQPQRTQRNDEGKERESRPPHRRGRRGAGGVWKIPIRGELAFASSSGLRLHAKRAPDRRRGLVLTARHKVRHDGPARPNDGDSGG